MAPGIEYLSSKVPTGPNRDGEAEDHNILGFNRLPELARATESSSAT